MTTDLKKLAPLEGFFNDFENYISDLTKNLLLRAEDDDEKIVIKEGAAPITGQISEIREYVLERAARSSEGANKEALRALRIANPTQIIKSGKGLFGSIGSIIGNLGIQRIIQEIKKIIQMIFDAFGWKMPKWLTLILLIINQLVELILGTKSAKHVEALSKAEVNYLTELTAAVKLQNAISQGDDSGSDDGWD